MITKHVDILDRFNRAMPLLGIPFFVFQANKHLKMAKEDDDAFIQGMRDLDDEPEERLKTHNVKQEWFLINSIAMALVLVWALSILILNNLLVIEFLFLVTTILAMSADLVIGKSALNVFTKKEEQSAEGSA